MLKKLSRLFVIKTRFEAFLVIYAIALGAIMRGQAYMRDVPGVAGTVLFLACLGVVFIAGAKLLDAVRPAKPQIKAGPWRVPVRRPEPALAARTQRSARRPWHSSNRPAPRPAPHRAHP